MFLNLHNGLSVYSPPSRLLVLGCDEDQSVTDERTLYLFILDGGNVFHDAGGDFLFSHDTQARVGVDLQEHGPQVLEEEDVES